MQVSRRCFCICVSLNKHARYLEIYFVLSSLITSRNLKDSTQCPRVFIALSSQTSRFGGNTELRFNGFSVTVQYRGILGPKIGGGGGVGENRINRSLKICTFQHRYK